MECTSCKVVALLLGSVTLANTRRGDRRLRDAEDGRQAQWQTEAGLRERLETAARQRASNHGGHQEQGTPGDPASPAPDEDSDMEDSDALCLPKPEYAGCTLRTSATAFKHIFLLAARFVHFTIRIRISLLDFDLPPAFSLFLKPF